MADQGAVGGVYLRHMSQKAKRRTVLTEPLDLTQTFTNLPVFYRSLGRCAIESVKLLYTVLSTGQSTTFKLGTIASTSALAAAQNTNAAAAVGDRTSITLASTLTIASVNPLEHRGLPVLAEDTPIVLNSTGVAGSGTARLIFTYFGIDD